MCKKVIECLMEYGYYFYEYSKVTFKEKGFSIYNVIGIGEHVDKNYYLEIDETGDLVVWSISGEVVNVIFKKEHYKMIFELGRVLENLM